MDEPRFLLDEDSVCYGCQYYRSIDEVIHDHSDDEYDENGGCCDVHCICAGGNMNGYRMED